MSDPLLLSLSQSALAKVVSGQKSASLAPFVHKKAPSFRALSSNTQHLPITSTSNNTSFSVAIPRYGLVQNICLRLTVAMSTVARSSESAAVAYDTAGSVLQRATLAKGWAYSLWDNCTISSHGKVISTLSSLAAFEYARAGPIPSTTDGQLVGWSMLDGGHNEGTPERGLGQVTRALALDETIAAATNVITEVGHQYITVLMPLPFGILRQPNGDVLDSTFLEQCDLTIQFNTAFQSRLSRRTGRSTAAGTAGVYTPQADARIVPGNETLTHGQSGEKFIGSGFEVNYLQLNSEDMKALASMKYSSPDSSLPKSNLYCNYFSEPAITRAKDADGSRVVELDLPITCKNCIIRSMIFVRREDDGAEPVGVAGASKVLGATQDPVEWGVFTPVKRVELFCNGQRYWSRDDKMAYAQQLQLANSMAVPSNVSPQTNICRVNYNVQDNVSRQCSGMASFRNVSTPMYKIQFRVADNVQYKVYVVHEILTITSYDANTGQIQNSLSL